MKKPAIFPARPVLLVALLGALFVTQPEVQASSPRTRDSDTSEKSSMQSMPAITRLAAGQENVVWRSTAADATGSLRLPLDVDAGTYLAGGESAGADALILDLLDRNGTFLRRLISPDSDRKTFNVLVPERGAFLAAKSRSGPVDFAIDITQNLLPAEDPHSDPSPSLLSPRLKTLAKALADGKSTDAFWDEVTAEGTPLVEAATEDEAIVTFLYRGARTGVRIFGAPSSDHDPMFRLGESDIWYRSYKLPSNTRISYRLAPDVPVVPGSFWQKRVAILATAQADPLNTRSWPADAIDKYTRKSVLELPEAPVQPFVDERPDTARGHVETFLFESTRLGNSREISLYRPADFDPADPDTVLLVLFDGDAYQNEVPVPTILDNMQADGVVPQTAAVLISNPDLRTRSRELPNDPAFAEAIATQILPQAKERLGIEIPAERTVLAGSSYGGLASTRIARGYPEAFGNVISLSGSYWWSPKGVPTGDKEYTARQVASTPQVPVRFFLAAGLFETGQAGSPNILSTNRHLRTVLEAKGYDVILREYASSHDYIYWRGALSDGLMALFGAETAEK
jgi:enterochelin esterase-like enzyme